MSLKKSLMTGVALVLLATPVAWSAGLRGSAAEASPSRQSPVTERTITVTGSGIAYGAPDIVTVALGVEAVNQDILAAMQDANARMDAVMQALQAGGVAPEDIRTENFSIYQDYGYSPASMGGEQPGPAYRVSIGVNITVRETARVADLLAAAVSAGANMVNYIQFNIADRSALEAEARDLAVADAYARAGQLAGTLGLSVGEPLRVVENADLYGQPVGLGGGGAGAALEAPPISQGTLSVSLSVTITFALEAGS